MCPDFLREIVLEPPICDHDDIQWLHVHLGDLCSEILDDLVFTIFAIVIL